VGDDGANDDRGGWREGLLPSLALVLLFLVAIAVALAELR
jgi:hypothetical protein